MSRYLSWGGICLFALTGCAELGEEPLLDGAREGEAEAKRRDTGFEDPRGEEHGRPTEDSGEVTAEALTPASALLVAPVGEWLYLDHTGVCRTPVGGASGANQPWNTFLSGDGTGGTFDDRTISNWLPGDAELGYGDGDEDKVISFGPRSSSKCISYYFRREFEVDDPSIFDSLSLQLLRDDGAVVYINGVAVARSALPTTVTPTTRATSTAEGDGEDTFFSFTGISASNLVAGTNLIAVEVHQSSATSSDVSFNLVLEGEIDPTSLVTESFIADDATIEERNPNTRFGGSSRCKADGAAGETNSGGDQVCLLQWDLSDLTDLLTDNEVTVLGAELRARVTSTTNDRYDISPVLVDWVEAQVTWNDPDGTLSTADWNGGVFGPTNLDDPVSVVNALNTGTKVVALPPALVQQWIETPSSNAGIAISDPVFRDGIDFSSSETSSPPLLVLTTEQVPIP